MEENKKLKIEIELKEGEQLEDRRNVGESSCNFGDGTDQRVHSLMFMMMMMMTFIFLFSLTTNMYFRSCFV